MNNAENIRLTESKTGKEWKKWGPYLTERQWGTVREDYSPDGSAWENVSHDMARSNAYRWGEEGIGGISDNNQFICFSWAFWNGKDPILKERLFGLTGNEGNHGEDVKEYYYYLDSTPTHTYMKMLYKYPHNEFPYTELAAKNREREKHEPEYELIDTGIFDKNEYFDIFMEYAKKDTDDILLQATIYNRGSKPAEITVLPTVWFRNIFPVNPRKVKNSIMAISENRMRIKHNELGKYYANFEGTPQLLFCDNETNTQRVHGVKSNKLYFKDGINNYIINKELSAVNPNLRGTKASAKYKYKIQPGQKVTVKVRISNKNYKHPFGLFDKIFQKRLKEADQFYDQLQSKIDDPDLKNIQRQAYAGMMWSKQFYYYNVKEWLDGDPGRIPPPEERKYGRNNRWLHLRNADIISMPDKWEYPWYAAWDLAFHCIPIARIDPEFAKEQLLLLLKERYIHPNGQMPAYEWNFSDVNPPVHAWAILRVYFMDKKRNHNHGDFAFLEKAFHKLLLNFTWWVNQKDQGGNNIFEGGFLGLDNIGVFDRSQPLPTGGIIEQADGTSWMAMFSLNMLKISLELAQYNPNYQDMAIKFLEHFLYIAGAMNNVRGDNVNLWDDEDNFYYDVLMKPDGAAISLRVRSIVGLIPLFAVETLNVNSYDHLPEFKERLNYFLIERPKLASLVSRWYVPGSGERRMFSLLRGFRMKSTLKRMLDETEFLSDYGIRALSKYHLRNPYSFYVNGATYSVKYQPGESDSSMFGGNSNWRGPIWFPINYMILESLLKFYRYYGDEFTIEYPIGSKKRITIKDAAYIIAERLMKIFKKDKKGHRPFHNHIKFQEDPHFKDYILFYEYFHGDTGRGLGASHQTGWTGLIADIIHTYYKVGEQNLKQPSEKKHQLTQ
jgi:hypothetical protein